MGEPFHDKESQQFVARYIERAPLSLEKLSIQDDIISYNTSNNTTHEFDTLEFLATLSAHVPKPYESLTRYLGRYSCRRRGERAKQAALATTETESQEADPLPDRPTSSWAACIKRIYEIDPLEKRGRYLFTWALRPGQLLACCYNRLRKKGDATFLLGRYDPGSSWHAAIIACRDE